MKSIFLTYSPEELLEEKSFIAWVLRGKNGKEWVKFIDDNPDFRDTANKARKIILLLHDTNDILDKESVLEIWQNIDRFEQIQQQKRRIPVFWKILTRAAAVLLIISTGTLGYLYLNEKDESYQFETVKADGNSKQARLMLSHGQEVILKKDNSSIDLSRSNQLVINNDSVIDISSNEQDGIEMNEVIIPYGKSSELLLSDGTKVWLNAGTRLAFPSKFSKKTREVYLDGEACFKVTKNENQPFIVNTGELDLKVLGTLFNVSAYTSDADIVTVLLEGSVAVRKQKLLGLGTTEVILKPNQRANYNKQNTEINIYDEPNTTMYIAWTEGWLQFSKESLQSVFTQLERYYDVEITLPASFPSSGLITGKLDLKDSLEEVLIALADVAQIDYRIVNNKIFIDKKMKEIQRK